MSRGYRQIGLSQDGETIILRKFKGNFQTPEYASADWVHSNRTLLKTGVGLDIETTGLDFNVHKIIEIAVRPFLYRTDTGEIVAVDAGYTGLEDPEEPLTEDVAKITGLTTEILRGKKIDWPRVEQTIAAAEVVIAHNAGFDRPFIDRKLPISRGKLWACSLRQVDWQAKGFPVHQLATLSLYHGFFVDAHRAMNDVNAMLFLLTCPDPLMGTPYSRELLNNCGRPRAVVFALDSPYESRSLLKARGYKWNAEKRTWFRSVLGDHLETELEWLNTNIYGGVSRAVSKQVPCIENFAAGDK